MLKTILTILYIIVSVALVLAIILQPSKGDGLGILGGSGNSVFFNRPRGFEGILERVTTWIVALFFLLSLAFLMM